jgi:hypothetical protein
MPPPWTQIAADRVRYRPVIGRERRMSIASAATSRLADVKNFLQSKTQKLPVETHYLRD